MELVWKNGGIMRHRERPIRYAIPFVFPFLISSTTVAGADTADDLVKVLGYAAYYQSVARTALDFAESRVEKSPTLTADQKASVKQRLEEMTESYESGFLAQLAQTYRVQFTEQELQEITRFYRSSAGHKLNDKQKLLQDRLSAVTRDLGVFVGSSAASLARGDTPSSATGNP